MKPQFISIFCHHKQSHITINLSNINYITWQGEDSSKFMNLILNMCNRDLALKLDSEDTNDLCNAITNSRSYKTI